MCGRYATTSNPATLAADLDAIDESGGESPPSYNVAPTDPVLTVVDRRDARRIRRMRWGLVPPWTKTLGKGPLLINARADSLADKPAFRNSFKAKRCLVPMDGWYEWQTEPTISGKVAKIPYYMAPGDGSRLFVAGLWTVWHDPAVQDSPAVLSCSIVTVDSIGHLAQVHDRMPLVMPRNRWDRWLDPDSPAAPDLLGTSETVVAGIAVRRVRPLVNSVKNNGPELLYEDPVEERAVTEVGEQTTLL